MNYIDLLRVPAYKVSFWKMFDFSFDLLIGKENIDPEHD